MNILIIIPSRFGSSRFEGKPLVDIHGKSLVKRTYEQALKTNLKAKVIVATDDDRIYTGMIAQQVREIINNAVDINTSTYETPEGIINIKDTYSINYTTIISYLISSLQYTNLKLNLLEEKIKLKLNI